MRINLLLSTILLSCAVGASVQAEYLELIPCEEGLLTNSASVEAGNTTYDGDTKVLHTNISNVMTERIRIFVENNIQPDTYNWVKVVHKYYDVQTETDDNLSYYLNIVDLDGFDNKSDIKNISNGSETGWITEYYDMTNGMGEYGCVEVDLVLADQNESPLCKKVTAKNDLAYIALFETEEDAKNYDGSVLRAAIGAYEGVVDRVNHTISIDVELLPGASISAPKLFLMPGASVSMPENADYSTPVDVVVTDIFGNEFTYTITVTAGEYQLPDGLSYEDCIARLNTVTNETYAGIVDDYSIILYNLCPEMATMSPREIMAFWEEVQNHAGEFSDATISALLNTCLQYAQLMQVSDNVQTFMVKVENESMDIIHSSGYKAWKNLLSDDDRLAVLDAARAAGGYELFVSTFESTSIKTAMDSSKNWEELKKAFDLIYTTFGFTESEYNAHITSVKNIETVFYNILEKIKAGNTNYKDLFIKYINDQKTEEEIREDKFSGSSAGSNSGPSESSPSKGGGVMITGTADKPVVVPGNKPAEEPPVELGNFQFEDCDEYDWAKESIQKLYEAKIVSGTDAVRYSPEKNVTRAEFVTMIVLAAGMDISSDEGRFDDITANDWFEKYVNTAVNAGIISGVGERSFAPNQNITRQDI